MNDCIDGTRLGRGIRRHPGVHRRPEIGDPARKDYEKGCKDRRFDRSSRTRAAKNVFEQSHCASLNVPVVVEVPPPGLPGKQPFMKVGVPASSMYLATKPKHVPCTVPLPEMFIVCFGKYNVPESVRHVWLLPHPEKLFSVPDGATVPPLLTELVAGALRS